MRIVGVRPPAVQARRNRLGYAFTVPARAATTVGATITAPVTGARYRVTRVEHLTGTDLHPLNPGDYLVGLVDVEPLSGVTYDETAARTERACIGYGVESHDAPRVTENERLCPACFAVLRGDLDAGRPLRGAWQPGPLAFDEADPS